MNTKIFVLLLAISSLCLALFTQNCFHFVNEKGLIFKIAFLSRILSYFSFRMEERDYMGRPEFKAKLFEIDDQLRNWDPSSLPTRPSLRPLPSSPALALIPEFKESLDDRGHLKRYAMGIDCDAVYPNILIGNNGGARNPVYLKAIGVTHVLNAAQGKRVNSVDTNEEFYQPYGIKFKGFPMDDTPSENIGRHFTEASAWIDEALRGGGRIYVHCWAGLSRSATLVLAYLIERKDMSVEEAVKTVLLGRRIFPNEGFLRRLVIFDMKLHAPA